jgi:hypothetical protein
LRKREEVELRSASLLFSPQRYSILDFAAVRFNIHGRAMTLTRQRSNRDPEKFPTVQLFLLAIVRLAEPIALTSIFPYAFPLVKKFHVGGENDASFYVC